GSFCAFNLSGPVPLCVFDHLVGAGEAASAHHAVVANHTAACMTTAERMTGRWPRRQPLGTRRRGHFPYPLERFRGTPPRGRRRLCESALKKSPGLADRRLRVGEFTFFRLRWGVEWASVFWTSEIKLESANAATARQRLSS